MFDLFRSRDKAVRILLGALLVVVGFSMLTYLIPSYNTGASADDVIVAEVGKEAITQQEVQRIVQNSMRGRQMPAEIIPNYVPQLVDSLVTERGLAYEAEKLGFQVTNAQVSDAIRQFLPSLFQDGKFLGTQAYAAMLGQQNMTIPEFEAEIRRQVLISRMRQVEVQGVVVTPQQIEQEYRKKNEKIKVQYVKLSSEKYKAESEPSQEDIQRYFTINQARYVIPERKNLAILIADQTKIEQSLTPADADLERLYNQNAGQFRVPEEVKVRHILLMTQGKPASEDAKIKAQAEDILKQVKGGANFSALVKKYSEDPAAKSPSGPGANGEYTVQRNGQMVKEFEDAAFTLKPGESEIVKTTYGYHIVQVVQHNPARVKPFAEVKAQMAADWKKQRVNQIMQDISDKAQSVLQQNAANPEKAAAELNMQVVKADNIEAGGAVPEIGTNSDFDQSLVGLKKGEVSAPVAVPPNKIALAVVTDVMPSRPATLAEVQGRVHDLILQNREAAAVLKHATELIGKAKAMGGDLAGAAKSMGLEAKMSDEVSRSGAIEGVGSASYVVEGFRDPDGAVFGPISTPDGTLVAKVVSHAAPDMALLAAQRTTIRDQLKTELARDRNSLFESGLRDMLMQKGVIKIHQAVINRLVASYRGA